MKVYPEKFQQIIAKIFFLKVFHFFPQEIFFHKSAFKGPLKNTNGKVGQ